MPDIAHGQGVASSITLWPEVDRLKFLLLQAEARLHAARQRAAEAEVDVEALRHQLKVSLADAGA